jgi:LmbE family N-acetylglucosaminyl deacetylase
MSENGQNIGIERVLGVFAHPDDPEFFAGGTFARWAAACAEITFLMATSGDKGSADPEMTHAKLIDIREEEERRAAAVLGVNEVIFLRYPDGELTADLALRRDITRTIRQKKPDVVVTTDPINWYSERSINHPDHRAIGEATLAAVYPTARDRLNFIELERDEGLEVHKTRQVYIAGAQTPNKKVDITDFLETQINSLREHKSQIKDIDELAGRLREWKRDPQSPDESPRQIESFHVVTFQQ